MRKEWTQWIAAALLLGLSFLAPVLFIIGVPAAVTLVILGFRTVKKRKEEAFYYSREE